MAHVRLCTSMQPGCCRPVSPALAGTGQLPGRRLQLGSPAALGRCKARHRVPLTLPGQRASLPDTHTPASQPGTVTAALRPPLCYHRSAVTGPCACQGRAVPCHRAARGGVLRQRRGGGAHLPPGRRLPGGRAVPVHQHQRGGPQQHAVHRCAPSSAGWQLCMGLRGLLGEVQLVQHALLLMGCGCPRPTRLPQVGAAECSWHQGTSKWCAMP